MTRYEGPSLRDGRVSIGLLAGPMARGEPAISSTRGWFAESERQQDIVYFSIFRDELLVGEIFLHDIGADKPSAALIGYHIFDPANRGQGIGSSALRLLTSWVDLQTDLDELVVITSGNNHASARIAEKAGFIRLGSPREDPSGVVLIRRRPPQHGWPRE